MSDEVVVPGFCLAALDAAQVALGLLGDFVLGVTFNAEGVEHGQDVRDRDVPLRILTANHGQVSAFCRVHQSDRGDGYRWLPGWTSVSWKGLVDPHTFDFSGWTPSGSSLGRQVEGAKLTALRAILEVCHQIDAEADGRKAVVALLESLDPENLSVRIFKRAEFGDLVVSLERGPWRNWEQARCFVRVRGGLAPTTVVINVSSRQIHFFQRTDNLWQRFSGWEEIDC